jgi:hypothetical protein
VDQRVCLITLCNPPEKPVHSWGTLVEEHRFNPVLLHSLNKGKSKFALGPIFLWSDTTFMTRYIPKKLTLSKPYYLVDD